MLFAIFTYQNTVIQDFPQVLRTWGRGAPQNLMGGVGGGCPMLGASVLVGGFSEKNCKMGDAPMPPLPPTVGNP